MNSTRHRISVLVCLAAAIAVASLGCSRKSQTATVPHDAGRVPGVHGAFVTGWIKRGPTGVIGTNKSDASQTVKHLVADLVAEAEAAEASGGSGAEARRDLVAELAARGHEIVSLEGWRAIDAAEIARGAALGRDRTKLASWPELLGASHAATS